MGDDDDDDDGKGGVEEEFVLEREEPESMTNSDNSFSRSASTLRVDKVPLEEGEIGGTGIDDAEE